VERVIGHVLDLPNRPTTIPQGLPLRASALKRMALVFILLASSRPHVRPMASMFRYPGRQRRGFAVLRL
jgi:hypothetical protein